MTETWALVITLISFFLADKLKNKLHLAVLNPILLSAVVSILWMAFSGTSYAEYKAGTKILSMLLTPATVCLAIPLYEQFSVLKGKKAAAFAGIIAGVLSSLGCVLLISAAFGLDHEMFATILPKSVTSAIGMELSEANGGIASVSAMLIILSGIAGNIMAPWILRICRIKDPVAKGIAIGSSSHAIGTAKAIEIGEVEGAVSSLAIVIAGLVTVPEVLLVSSFF